jgi:hypothetical protein
VSRGSLEEIRRKKRLKAEGYNPVNCEGVKSKIGLSFKG